MKYLLLERSDGTRYPVLFPEFLDHARTAGRLVDKVVDAGKCQIVVTVDNERRSHCYGESISLGLTLDKVDKVARAEAEYLIGRMVTT